MLEDDVDFRTQLDERIARIVAQRNNVRDRLVELNHALNDLEKRLNTAVEMYRLEFGKAPHAVADEPREPRPRARRPRTSGESWNSAVQAVLADAAEPLHITEIWRRVQQRGFTTTAKDPMRAIASVLVRHPGTVRTRPNTYSLMTNGGAPSGRQQSLVPTTGNQPDDSPGGDT